MKTNLLFACLILVSSFSYAGCTPAGDQVSFGTANVWIGYVYGGTTFDRYKGYINEGNSSSPSFDESFTGSSANFSTFGCSVLTDTFSVRYKLSKSFSDGDYLFTVGGDDGYRLSLDGGITWPVNNYNDHGYTTSTYNIHLNGSVDMVLEYYEQFGDNRVSFDVTKLCSAVADQSIYGTNNQWNGYIYSGTSFQTYKGLVTEGSALTANFDESFGGDNVTYSTSDCSINTNVFSARYRLKNVLPFGTYTITVGGDDGYRLSLDGGISYVIDKWGDQSYNTTTYTAVLSGNYNFVLEYYENGGGNRISFNISGGSVLPVTLVDFKAAINEDQQTDLSWATMMESNIDRYEIQRSDDGQNFHTIDSVLSKMKISTSDYQLQYTYNDKSPIAGISYYRIKIIGKNGLSNQSAIVQVNNIVEESTRIFPTVIQNNILFVQTNRNLKDSKIELFDLRGNKVYEAIIQLTAGRQTLEISKNSSLPRGTYAVRLSNNGQLIKSQLIISQH